MIEVGPLSLKFFLIFLRILSVLSLVPLFSSRTVSIAFKSTLSLAIGYAIFEHVQFQLKDYGDFFILEAIFKEILIGMSMGFVIRVIFSAVFAAGDVIAVQTGLSFARFMDPASMTHVSVIESLKNLLAVIVFFSVDAHHHLIRGLLTSFDLVPLGPLSFKSGIFLFMSEIVGRIFVLGLKIGAPVIVVLLLVEFTLTLLARMVPQMNIFIEGLPLKALIAISVLSFSLSFFVPYLGRVFNGIERDVFRVIRLI